ncbi:3-deoxy-7-phosphoheptulonate synthase [Dehalobacterium formicoaceticum]|uniref:3-deoxy-7-phosphoheptulonate synthase n=1 Tax=Dehalobacterium formicoaceticum TaxID=51515 RepID=A0ABT1Y0Q2_9FIRM|nr:3-deoxy-7-phosphoheptulonate synthase [Dehalobacterium formicoaceticum]MCR6544437.1 3-deoxy-7-phosphoheptulonate synthase [Dehalobacterium formicoaceticum]
MIIVMSKKATEENINAVTNRLEHDGFSTHIIRGVEKIVIGAIGDKKAISSMGLELMAGVENIVPIMKPYKLVSREVKSEDSVIDIDGVKIGGDNFIVIAGPCAVESRDQLLTAAEGVKEAGAHILRGGAFKPRTSPYSFQGLEEKGLEILAEARDLTGLKIVTEIIDAYSLDMSLAYVDLIQIGARNMQNFHLLRQAGKSGKPVILKRGLSATIEEWLMAAEYIMSEGNYNVILCERGIRTFETATRNTLDISAVPLIKGLSHLPIIIDPSHATGDWHLVTPLAKAALAVGANGIMVEVHPNPLQAMCDGPQSLSLKKFSLLMEELKPLSQLLKKIV